MASTLSITSDAASQDVVIKDEDVVIQDDVVPDEYYAGLVDAQLGVTFRMKNQYLRATLTSSDARVADELSAKFIPTKITTVRRPGKKDVCTTIYEKDAAREVLAFAAKACVLKKDLAAKALDFLNDKATPDDVMAIANRDNPELDSVSVSWVSGFFDVRGTVVKPEVHPDGKKRTRGAVKLILPKSEKPLMPALQRVVNGRVKKSSPCRLVFESKDTIRKFVDVVGAHVRVKRADLAQVV